MGGVEVKLTLQLSVLVLMLLTVAAAISETPLATLKHQNGDPNHTSARDRASVTSCLELRHYLGAAHFPPLSELPITKRKGPTRSEVWAARRVQLQN